MNSENKYYDKMLLKTNPNTRIFKYLNNAKFSDIQILSGLLESSDPEQIIEGLKNQEWSFVNQDYYIIRKFGKLAALRLELDRWDDEDEYPYIEYEYGKGYRDTIEYMIKLFEEWKEIRNRPYPQLVTLYQETENGHIKIHAEPIEE